MSEMVTATAKNKKRLKIVFGLTVAYMFAEAETGGRVAQRERGEASSGNVEGR